MPAPLPTLILVLACETALWAVSRAISDATIADVFWGFGFVLTAAASAMAAPPTDARDWLLIALVTIWAVRLGWHLYARWQREGHEDRRFAAMRAKAGAKFEMQSLFTVFWAQGIAMWIVSWPLQAGLAAVPVPFGWLDFAGMAIAVSGLILEALADYQLARFAEQPQNRGKVLTSGPWAWSRHPNYFGDAMFWWGIFLIALAGSGAWWSVLGPLLMTLIFARVSVGLVEKDAPARRPAYADYARRTPAFLPSLGQSRKRT